MQENYVKQQSAKNAYLNNLPYDPNDEHYKRAAQIHQDETYIELSHYNKKQFEVNEEVELFVNIKNVLKLQVKVFEINTDNYYRKNMTNFTTDINLDGLEAKY